MQKVWLPLIVMWMGATAVWGGQPLRVQVSVPPQVEWMVAVGGEHVVVEAFLDQGQPCGDFNPLPSQMRRLAHTDLFFLVGAIYESALVPKLEGSFPKVAIIPAPEGFDYTAIQACCAQHAHDPHLWLNPDYARAQLQVMVTALSAAMPEHSETFAARAHEYEISMQRTLTQIRAQLEEFQGRSFFCLSSCLQ